MKVIESINNPYIKYLFSLKDNKKNILKEKIFLIEGEILINEAYSKNIVEQILITDKKMFNNLDVKKTLVSDKIISKLSSKKTNIGAIAICKVIDDNIEFNKMKKIVVLDSINDPGNFGTIIRTAKAFGYDAVVCVGNSPFKYSSKVLSSSQGAIFKIPVVTKTIKELEEFYCYHFVLDKDSKEITTLNFKNDKEKYALVLGNEANGISDDVKKSLKGEKIFIKINDEIESLNVASAAAIALFIFK